MRTITFALSLCAILSCAFPATAAAKINIGESIDWVVVDSDHIISGTITKIETMGSKPAWETITVAIDKTVKGTAAKSATFKLSPQWGPLAKAWQDEKKPMLFFLVKHKDPETGKDEWWLRTVRLAHCALFLGDVKKDWGTTRTMQVFTREFDVLTTPKDILTRVEKIVAATGKSPRRESYQVEVPFKTAVHDALYSGSAVYLILPIDEQYGAKRMPVEIGKHRGFLIHPDKPGPEGKRPWVWYAPTIGSHPNQSNGWILRKLLDRGFYVAGINVGESYGSPAGRKIFSEFRDHLVDEYKLEPKARLLAQSRGGLMLYNWAVEHPDQVKCIAGIYPVCDLRSYPGLANAASAYGLSAAELEKQLAKHNPIDRLAPLAKAGVPILHIHGDKDGVVPLEKNSQVVHDRYKALGGKMSLIVVPGKGHAEIAEYFQEPRLVQFLLDGTFSTDGSDKKSP